MEILIGNPTNARQRDERQPDWRCRPLARAITVCSCAALLLSESAMIYAAPPAANALPRPSAAWLRAGTATNLVSGNTMTINQSSQKAILNWDSFDIGKDGRVQFVQPSSNAIALNRIGGNSPSQIFGQLGANGSIYLINTNGVVFGAGSQVNVHGLLVSSLNIDENLFLNSALTRAVDDGNPALAGGSAPDAMIRVESGARIVTDSGGQVLMFAPQVINAGEISTPDGQTLLAAAKDKVYLAASNEDPNIRGLLVEVGSGGTVENVGKIVAERGNITLLGLAVNQNGYLRATTSVDVNGSIRLLARDQATAEPIDAIKSEAIVSFNDLEAERPSGYKMLAIASRTGTVTLGQNSRTVVEADVPAQGEAAKQAANAQPQALSRVDVEGKTIDMREGSAIVAKGGVINLVATSDPKDPHFVAASAPDDSRIYLGKNTLLDVSGYDVVKPMSSRVVEVNLRANELQDAPLQRKGVLYGKTVKVDLEKGSPLISEQAWQAIKDGVKKEVTERLSSGGAVNMKSRGDVVFSSGSTLDMHGGKVTYTGAPIATTRLLSGRQIIDISDADPNRRYDGVYGLYVDEHDKWGKTTYGWGSFAYRGIYQNGYDEGKDAGSLNVESQKLYGLDLLTLKAAATHGQYQRTTSNAPNDGRLSIALGQNNPFAASQNVLINSGRRSADIGVQDALPDQPLFISADSLSSASLASFALKANGEITLAKDATIRLSAGKSVFNEQGECTSACSLALTGTKLQVDGKVYAAGGSIKLATTGPQNSDKLGNFAVTLGAGSVLDVSGQWINDRLGGTPTAPLRVRGGSIEVSASGDLTVAAGAILRADGGAQLTSDGAVLGGDGGSISLATTARQTGDIGSRLILDGTMSAYGFNQGGKLSLEANAVQIGGARPNDTNILWLDPDVFTRGGFSQYAITANLHGVEVASGSVVNLRQSNRVLSDLSAATRQATGADIRNFSKVVTLPDWQRQATSIALNVANSVGTRLQPLGDIRINQGVVINGEPGASIDLISERSIYIDGVLNAPGGKINAHINAAKGDQDPGYVASQSIWLGEHARLLARAAHAEQPSVRGLTLGPVWDAGTISLNADRGSLIAAPGSVLDVSGAGVTRSVPNAKNLLQGYVKQTINAAAGTIDLSAAETLAMFGDLRGFSTGDGLAGSLNIRMDANQRGEFNGTDRFPNQYGERVIEVGNALPSWDLVGGFGQALPGSWKGRGFVSIPQIQNGGFSRLQLAVTNKLNANSTAVAAAGLIRFNDDVSLALSDSLLLNATNIDVNNRSVSLRAGSIGIGASDGSILMQQTEALRDGTGQFSVVGQFIELLGSIGVSGAQRIDLYSAGDIRARSQLEPGSGNLVQGVFSTRGDLSLAASQIYPTTLSDYLFKLTGTHSVFSTRTTGSRTPILSAGGTLRVQAPVIEHGGVLSAPLGTVELTASRSLHLAPNSTIDVSANGQLIPFGRLQGGDISWIYPLTKDKRLVINQAPEKQVLLNAPDVAMDSGATINLSGGGDIYGIEAVPGPGGSKDFLDPAFAKGAFAVLPQLNSSVSPYDQVEMANSGIAFGSTVYLDGANGLPAGNYAVLPAHYALLPGAYLITPTGNTATPGQTSVRVDNTPMVSGRFGRAFTNQYASQWQGFYVESGAAARTRTEFRDARGDDYFGDKGVNLARDAGRVSISAQQQLALNGGIAATTQNGRGAQMDVFADLLEVVAAGSELGTTVGVVQLDAGALSKLGIDSLLLGGVRSRDGDATAIDVKSSAVTIKDGAVLSAPDVILAARDQVTVEDNAEINVSGKSRQSESLLKIGAVNGDGSGALLRVSSAPQTDVQRSGNITGAGGNLSVGESARLRNAKSILLDATGTMRFASNVALPDGSLNISANRISLGDNVGATTGVVFSNAQLANLRASELRLSSRDAIDFYGPVNFVSERTELNAGALRSQAPGVVKVSADTLQLSNTTGATAGATAAGGQLLLSANKVELGNTRDKGARMVLGGFDSVQLGEQGKTNTIEGNGVFKLQTAAPVNVFADRVSAGVGADLTIISDGAVTLARANAPVPTSVSTKTPALGAKLSISGKRIEQGTAIELPSGIVALTATGSGADDGVVLRAGSSIDVGGRTIAFPNSTVRTAGGTVSLTTKTGDVSAESGAIVRVGGSAGGDAGQLDIVTANQLDWQASIDAAAASGYKGGSLSIDAGYLTDFDGWLSRIGTGGIDQRVSLRSRNGDLSLTKNIRANEVNISADRGALQVASTIDASGTDGGSITLNAGSDLIVGANARLRADATSASGRGGRIALGTTGGSLRFEQGSRMAVSAGADNVDANGLIKLRAPRTSANDDVAVVDGGVAIAGARRIDLEGFAVYQSSTVDNTLLNLARNSAAAFMSHASAIESRLSGLRAQGMRVRPGIEVDSSGDLTVSATIDFSQPQWRFGADGAPGALTLRAANNLLVKQSLLDGFAQDTSDLGGVLADPFDTLLTGASWDYTLTAGADLGAANRSAVQKGTGDLIVTNGADIITGDGDIGLHAGRDFLQDGEQSSVIASLGAINKTWYENVLTGSQSLLPDSGTFNNVYLFLTTLHQVFFPERGGNVEISAGNNVSFKKSGNFFSDWIQRLGGNYEMVEVGTPLPTLNATTWGILLAGLRDQQGVAVLGGGNLNVRAGGDISNLNALLPVTGKQVGTDGANKVQWVGGGDASVRADGSILSPRLLVDKGKLLLEAGGDIRAAGGGLNTVLALADTQATLRARGAVTIDAVFNSTMMPQSNNQWQVGESILIENYFFTYTPKASLTVSSLNDSVSLINNSPAVKTALQSRFAPIRNEPMNFAIYPGQLRIDAPQGDILFPESVKGQINRMALFSTPDSQLVMNAGGNIRGASNSYLFMADVDPATLPGIASPQIEDGFVRRLFNYNDRGPVHGSSPLHLNDSQPVIINALNDIISEDEVFPLTFNIAKPVRVSAGRDIASVSFYIQHNRDTDTSELLAGRDLGFPLVVNDDGKLQSYLQQIINVSGPGRLDLIAGRDIDLGGSFGIKSTGNRDNGALPDSGADVTILAGINGPTALTDPILYNVFAERYLNAALPLKSTFIEWFENTDFAKQFTDFNVSLLVSSFTGQTYATPTQAQNAFRDLPALTRQAVSLEAYRQTHRDNGNYAADLVNFVSFERFAGDLAGVMTEVLHPSNPFTSNTEAAAALALLPAETQLQIALRAFNGVPAIARRELVLSVMFNEVRLGGTENARHVMGENTGFARGDAAIAALFPSKTQWKGDLSLVLSTVLTLGDGDINLLTPGGDVNVGIAGNIGDVSKAPGDLGIITQRYGVINGLASGNFNVNQSRMFSLDGGDMVLWSSDGNIDAGKGAKSALTIPPPDIKQDPATGNLTVEFPSAVAGSGIQTAKNDRKRATDRGALVAGVSSSSDTYRSRQRFFRSLKAGDTYLLAPHGVINAGDAGINSGGNLILAAPRVLGADNITFGGVGVGVPVSSAISAGTMSLGNAASAATGSATQSMNGSMKDVADVAAAGIAFVTVDIIGIGD